MHEELPEWLKREVHEFLDELPKDERASALAIWEAGEYTVEPFTTPNGTKAVVVDLGAAELWTCRSDGVAS